MIVKLDQNGEAISDSLIETEIEWYLDRQLDIHTSNLLVIHCLRYLLCRIPISERPQITWIFYGKEVHFNDDLRSSDAWNNEYINLLEKYLGGLISYTTSKNPKSS